MNIKQLFAVQKPAPLINIAMTIVGVALVRTFLENFSSLYNSEPFIFGYTAFTHFLFFYFSIILSLAIVIYAVTKISVDRILSTVVTFFPLVWLAPFLDLLISGGKGWRMAYDILSPNEIIPAFFTFFGKIQSVGVTPGIRIEIALILIGIFCFVYFNTNNFKKALLGSFLGYVVFFLYATLPSLLAIPWLIKHSETYTFVFYNLQFQNSWLTNNLNSDNYTFNLQQTDFFMARIFWLAIVLQSTLLFKIFSPTLWQAWIKNLRTERILYYTAIGILGMFLSPNFLNITRLLNLPNILSILVFIFLIALSACFAVTTNDENDIEIDRISNHDRPLVTNSISIEKNRSIGIIIFTLILGGAILLNTISIYLLLLFQFVYFMYSAYPLRLRRFIFFSPLLLGFNALIIAMAGFYLVSPEQNINIFPKNILWIIFFAFVIISNVKDIKDYEGDKLQNIQTIPTIFGKQKGKLIIACLISLFLLFLALYVKDWYFLLCTLPFIYLVFILINKKIYQEKHLFNLFFVYMAFLLIYFKF